MFEWLDEELAAVKTPRFHQVQGPADQRLREAINKAAVQLPRSYRQFVLRFGNAKFYRQDLNGYALGVLAAPREAPLPDGTRLYHIAWNDSASVYVKSLDTGEEAPVFEYERERERRSGSFEEWLRRSCAAARRSYGRMKWAAILRGPAPFTEEERRVIAARRAIDWAALGPDNQGNQLFRVTNTGVQTVNWLTLGVRSKDRTLNGAVALDVSAVGPGQTATLARGCYRDLVRPEELEVFALPEPQPEDRDYYWEFRPSK
jgi:hypothetical protein